MRPGGKSNDKSRTAGLAVYPVVKVAAGRWRDLNAGTVPVLLLSGISTGVVAPFISGLLGASTLLVLMMVVVSSLLSPFSHPALVSLLVGRTIEISFLFMVKILAMVVFLRRGRDSNPRTLWVTRFPSVRAKPATRPLRNQRANYTKK